MYEIFFINKSISISIHGMKNIPELFNRPAVYFLQHDEHEREPFVHTDHPIFIGIHVS